MKDANIILLFKKGDKDDLKNYRPISLLSIIYKLFTQILVKRLETILNTAQPIEQAGFRSGYSTMDNIQVLQQVIERCNEYELPLCLAFVDYEKAFDSIKLSSLFDAIEKQSIEPSYINLLRSIYTNATATISINDTPITIKLEKDVHQADTISPKLFKTLCRSERKI